MKALFVGPLFCTLRNTQIHFLEKACHMPTLGWTLHYIVKMFKYVLAAKLRLRIKL